MHVPREEVPQDPYGEADAYLTAPSTKRGLYTYYYKGASLTVDKRLTIGELEEAYDDVRSTQVMFERAERQEE
jgi:hypothetical protein